MPRDASHSSDPDMLPAPATSPLVALTAFDQAFHALTQSEAAHTGQADTFSPFHSEELRDHILGLWDMQHALQHDLQRILAEYDTLALHLSGALPDEIQLPTKHVLETLLRNATRASVDLATLSRRVERIPPRYFHMQHIFHSPEFLHFLATLVMYAQQIEDRPLFTELKTLQLELHREMQAVVRAEPHDRRPSMTIAQKGARKRIAEARTSTTRPTTPRTSSADQEQPV